MAPWSVTPTGAWSCRSSGGGFTRHTVVSSATLSRRALRGHTQPTLPAKAAGEEMVQATTSQWRPVKAGVVG